MNPNDLIIAYREGTLLDFVNEHMDELLETNGEPEWAAEHIDLSIPPRYGKEYDRAKYVSVLKKCINAKSRSRYIFRIVYAILLENIEIVRRDRKQYFNAINKLYEYRRALPWAQRLCNILTQDYMKNPYVVDGEPQYLRQI